MKRRIVILGPPGSGKGTVAQMLEEKFHLPHISTGQWFRREMDEHTVLGEHVRHHVERGGLVPDSLVIGLLEHWLTPELLGRGFLFDGFPRTLGQAEALDQFCEARNAPLELVLYLDCPKELVLERITGRRVCSSCGKVYHVRCLTSASPGECPACGGELVQRVDDTEEVVVNRFETFARMTEPVIDYYRKSDRLVVLDAALGSEAASRMAERVIQS